MTCPHTNAFCAHSVVCLLKTDEQKAEACTRYGTERNPNKQAVRTCVQCLHVAACQFSCFRQESDRRTA